MCVCMCVCVRAKQFLQSINMLEERRYCSKDSLSVHDVFFSKVIVCIDGCVCVCVCVLAICDADEVCVLCAYVFMCINCKIQ